RTLAALVSNEKTTVALPVPLWFGALRCSQGAFAVAVQGLELGYKDKMTLSAPPSGPSNSEVIPMDSLGPSCVTGKLIPNQLMSPVRVVVAAEKAKLMTPLVTPVIVSQG